MWEFGKEAHPVFVNLIRCFIFFTNNNMGFYYYYFFLYLHDSYL